MTQRGRAAGRSTGGRRPGGPPREDLGARRLRLRTVIEPVLRDAGYDLEELTVSRAGRRHVVRVIIDGDGRVSLDAVADASRAVSAALDKAEESDGDLIAGEYQLEVSSPGVDRPLTLPRHWRRNVGRLVKVTVRDAAGERPVVARVVAADDAGVTFDLAGGTVTWGHPELGPGRVQIEFNRPGDEPDEIDYDEIDDEIDDEEDVEGEER
ncbi:ribosome maturation factor RimP [Solwaraspora sp. WMMD1047]|uniref:ribosome maturation factor RimP n=1 Tax=Solwaraspora sp. WMMD1047 TaxID=3016102 RepID=UPI0024174310|nr:ribosome maturation factor RimP [Solwaraspora sp. WMMD1047]MDG4829663.1 ribosome maturation factor RimP [Solwaraspora sp. WMMD1047]